MWKTVFFLNLGHESVIKYLIDKGAIVNAVDKYGYIPLHRATLNSKIYLI